MACFHPRPALHKDDLIRKRLNEVDVLVIKREKKREREIRLRLILVRKISSANGQTTKRFSWLLLRKENAA